MADLKTTAEERAAWRQDAEACPEPCEQCEQCQADLRLISDIDTLLAENARLRAAEAALRGMLATHAGSHSEGCSAWASRDEDVCTCVDGCAEPHCDCGSLDARNAARAALGEP